MRECAIDLSRAHTNKAHRHEVGLTAVFVPVTPGLTRGHPVRIGHAARIGDGFEIRINSATPRVQLTPAAPAGDEYFVANITATYIGGSSSTDLPALPKGLHLEGRSGHHYNVAGDRLYGPCPDTPPPALPATPQIYPGQSVTGNVCWTVATNDQSTLELYRFYPFRSSYQWRLIWFAFH